MQSTFSHVGRKVVDVSGPEKKEAEKSGVSFVLHPLRYIPMFSPFSVMRISYAFLINAGTLSKHSRALR